MQNKIHNTFLNASFHTNPPEKVKIIGSRYRENLSNTEIIRSTRYSIHANSQYAISLNLTAPCVFSKYFNSLKYVMLFLNFLNVFNAFCLIFVQKIPIL